MFTETQVSRSRVETLPALDDLAWLSTSVEIMNPTFGFACELIPWEAGKGNWVFATVPLAEATEIKDIVPNRRGFGSVRVKARIGEVEWATSIFPDSKTGTFVLPVKAAVRKKVGVDIGDVVDLELDILIDD